MSSFVVLTHIFPVVLQVASNPIVKHPFFMIQSTPTSHTPGCIFRTDIKTNKYVQNTSSFKMLCLLCFIDLPWQD